MAVCAVVTLAAPGAAAGGASYRNAEAERIARAQCEQTDASAPMGSCIIEKFGTQLKAARYAQWAKMQIAGADENRLRPAAQEVGWSLDKTRRLNQRFVHMGIDFGTS